MEEKRGIKRNVLIISIVIIALFILVLVYLTFIAEENCQTFECFQENMRECKKATYVNDGKEATWNYVIDGKEGENCAVNVELLQAKKGDIDIQNIEGYDMTCYYPLGIGNYPEKDLSKCHGRLKEELQTLMIRKLHSVIIENIGEIREGLNSPF